MRAFCWVFLFVVGMSIVGSLTRSGRESSIGRPAMDGDVTTLGKSAADLVAVGATEDVLSRFGDLAYADDTIGMQQLLVSGQVVLVPGGTRVKVIDSGIFVCEVRVMSGKLAGRSGFVLRDFMANTTDPRRH